MYMGLDMSEWMIGLWKFSEETKINKFLKIAAKTYLSRGPK